MKKIPLILIISFCLSSFAQANPGINRFHLATQLNAQQVKALVSNDVLDIEIIRGAFKRKGFNVLAFLNEGRKGLVYLAKDMASGNQVAIKIEKENSLNKFRRSLKRFEEVKEKIGEHPNIVKLHSINTIEIDGESYQYVNMEYFNGVTLKKFIETSSMEGLSPDVVSKISEQINSAINHFHEKGLLHTTVTLNNILIDFQYNVKVIDYDRPTRYYHRSFEMRKLKKILTELKRLLISKNRIPENRTGKAVKAFSLDDSDSDNELTIRYLRSVGYETEQTNTFDEAKQAVSAAAEMGEPFSLVVTDWDLRGSSLDIRRIGQGFDFAVWVRENYPDTTVVLHSSAFDPFSKADAFAAWLAQLKKRGAEKGIITQGKEITFSRVRQGHAITMFYMAA